jgi:UDP-2,3-diacylglucosamine pyrophosphatase LpxH
MQQKSLSRYRPEYKGTQWIGIDLPRKCQPWILEPKASIRKDSYHPNSPGKELRKVLSEKPWKWPKRNLYFISDIHADTDAFIASLVASGGVRKTGPKDKDFKLTGEGRKSRFLIGGDCLDKGPSNLRLLRNVKMLMDKGARVHILAGNHDIRSMMGINSVGLEPDPRTDHFFVRMGPKTVPFLKEICDEYLQHKNALRGIPTSSECRRIMYPPKSWFDEFPEIAGWSMPDALIDQELQRMGKKLIQFAEDCDKAGMDVRMVYAAVKKWQSLFLKPKGEFFWFFDRMMLSYDEGSFLFIHAGIDDRIAHLINERGFKHLNRKFRKEIRGNPFDFYYGPLANTIRTKYRKTDRPLTRRGVKLLKKSGIQVIVHGHKHLFQGQRIMLRKGMLNFECDSTIDRGSRKRANMEGTGAAVTIFKPKGVVVGISTDYPQIKVFAPSSAHCIPYSQQHGDAADRDNQQGV